MKKELKKYMLSECRCVTYLPAKKTDGKLADEAMAKAVTVNENLLTLGYTLKPGDLVTLAESPSLDGFYDEVAGLMEEVKAAPMYPNFPTQVMEMSEAMFRYHQMLHYLSTYGREALFGEKVNKGWLPEQDTGEKTESDTVLLKAKVLELLEEDQAAVVLAGRILRRRERMSPPERELVRLALEEISPEELEKIKVPFKENLMDIFTAVMDNREKGGKEKAHRILRTLCQHTGDVLKCVDYQLVKHGFHFHTAEKRFLVKLLESYPAVDFKANLILSRKKAERSLIVLQYLDYNIYARSDEHKEAVRALRDGELKSWEGQARYLLEKGEKGALDFVAARPGMLLRMTAWLLRMGYPAEEIKEKLLSSAESLSAQTLMTVLAHFGNKALADRREAQLKGELVKELSGKDGLDKAENLLGELKGRGNEIAECYGIMEAVLSEKLGKAETPLRGKKVYLDMGGYCLEHSVLRFNNKSEEGGYIRSGIAYRIPENVNRLRFFVYWNDENRVDIDLHASGHSLTGEEIHVGWNSNYKKVGVIHSGDITHSNAAEYIDIDLTKPIREISANINLFSGKRFFGQIETCYVGMMAVERLGQEVKLYNPANCFFSHELKGKSSRMNYGFVDVVNRCLVFDGSDAGDSGYYDYEEHAGNRFNIRTYLDILIKSQGAELVETGEEADVILKMDKAETEKEISFIDSNFFL